MMKLKTLTAGIVASLALGYGANTFAAIGLGAVAQSYLEVDNFKIRDASNGSQGAAVSGTLLSLAPLTGLIPAGKVRVSAVSSTAKTNPNVNGVSNAGNQTVFTVGSQLNVVTSVGAGYTAVAAGPANAPPLVKPALLQGGALPTSSFAGGTSTSIGNAITGSDDVVVDSTLQLQFPNFSAGSASNQTLNSRFAFTVAPAPATEYVFELSFDAIGFMRAALGPNLLFAKASRAWTATVSRLLAGGATEDVLSWSPNGKIDASSTCTNNLLHRCVEVADAFNLNQNQPTAAPGEDFESAKETGAFQFELGLAAGTYIFDITHSTNVDAFIIAPVPEPTSIALIGLGMLGMGAASRRRKA